VKKKTQQSNDMQIEMKNDEYFMKLALAEAETALANNEFPVGCVIIYDGKIIARGSRLGSSGIIPNEVDHAEITALRNLGSSGLNIERNRASIYCTMEPCLMCFGAILLSGIGKIVYAYEDAMGGGTNCDPTRLSPLYRNNRIEIVRDILRSESLKLFKAFFANPQNTYWKGSLLAEYTLSQ
jgi:tRNA(adenine34) deaminase